MHAQVVTFGLNGVTEDEYHSACEALTGTFADLPGLLAKVWIGDSSAGRYGGIYLWRDGEACARYLAGEVFDAVRHDPDLTGVTSADFEVFADLTKATQPGISLI